MPARALSPCKQPGCPALVEKPGYCPDHAPAKPDRSGFKTLDRKKTDEQRKFYSGRRWTAVSIAHRKREPLCRRCKEKGVVVPGTLVHHNPELQTLLDRGWNPYASQFLETLCDNCHLAELRAKRRV